MFLFALIILILIFAYDFFYRTLHYKNYLKECSIKDYFCGIKIINMDLPEKYVSKLLDIAKNNGKRVEIPKKRQKNIASSVLLEELPEIEEYYAFAAPIVSKQIGETVLPLDKDIKNRLTLVVYEQEGDYIDWHFDTNHYEKRYFTLLVPVTFEPTCGNYQYKNSEEEDEDVEVKKGQAILFEGDKVYHRGKMLCKDQYRVILSLTFVTSNNMNLWNYTMHKMKEFGIYGK